MANVTPTELWDKVRQNLPRLPFVEDAVASYYCATDARTPTSAKAILLGALAYFISPIDLCPDIFAVIGFADDAALLMAAIAQVAGAINDSHREQAREALRDQGGVTA